MELPLLCFIWGMCCFPLFFKVFYFHDVCVPWMYWEETHITMAISRVPFSKRRNFKTFRAILIQRCPQLKLGIHHLRMMLNLPRHELNFSMGAERQCQVCEQLFYIVCIFAYSFVWTLATNDVVKGENGSLFRYWWGLRTLTMRHRILCQSGNFLPPFAPSLSPCNGFHAFLFGIKTLNEFIFSFLCSLIVSGGRKCYENCIPVCNIHLQTKNRERHPVMLPVHGKVHPFSWIYLSKLFLYFPGCVKKQ